MKKRYLYIILPLVGFALVYFSFSFIKLEANPVNWSEDNRTGVMLLGFLLGVGGGIIAGIINDNIKEL